MHCVWIRDLMKKRDKNTSAKKSIDCKTEFDALIVLIFISKRLKHSIVGFMFLFQKPKINHLVWTIKCFYLKRLLWSLESLAHVKTNLLYRELMILYLHSYCLLACLSYNQFFNGVFFDSFLCKKRKKNVEKSNICAAFSQAFASIHEQQ